MTSSHPRMASVSSNDHSRNISEQLTECPAHMNVNRSASIHSLNPLPRKRDRQMTRRKPSPEGPAVPAASTGESPWRQAPCLRPPHLHLNLSFLLGPGGGGCSRSHGMRAPRPEASGGASSPVDPRAFYPLTEEGLLSLPAEGSGHIAEVRASRLQLWPSAFICLVIFFKNTC